MSGEKREQGCRIAGSNLFRAYCSGCGDPIRVAKYLGPDAHQCVHCHSPNRPPQWNTAPPGTTGIEGDRDAHVGEPEYRDHE